MKHILKIVKILGKCFLALLGAAVGVVLVLFFVILVNSRGVEAPFVDDNGSVLPNSIAMHADVMINGVPQRLTIRGRDADNPVY